MSFKNKDLIRLIKISRLIGVSVKVINKTGRYPYSGTYSFPTKKSKALIELYKSSQTSETELLLTLLHELGHHVDFLVRGRIAEAYYYIDQEYCPLWARKSILVSEKYAIQYAEALHKYFELKIPLWKVKKECALDYYQYFYFYKNAKWVTKKQTKKFLNSWDNKYKKSLVTVK